MNLETGLYCCHSCGVKGNAYLFAEAMNHPNPRQWIDDKDKQTLNTQYGRNTDEIDFNWKDLHNMVSPWAEKFDNTEGGTNGSPKFPMPNAYNFLLQYAHLSDNLEVSEHIELTLNKMAFGGINDQIGGGFARYSVDKFWKAPHFEKMLYDNGQLVSLYSEAFLKYQNPLYKKVVFETLKFVER